MNIRQRYGWGFVALTVLVTGIVLLAVLVIPALGQSARPTCAGVLPSRLIVRERARVSPVGDESPLNVRENPGTDNERIGTIPIGGVFYVLDGPECTTTYTWYLVTYQGIVGWVAEGSASTYFTEPYPPAP
ncbi:MAG: SH3 domain-containing protein [bacterium]|nr:SH3 domain-containing protein [bacterium]